MRIKFFSSFTKLCSKCSNSLSNRVLSWLIRVSNYKLPMPNYKQAQVRDSQWQDHLARHPAYKDLCLWVLVHRDRAVRRLLSSNEDERSELIGRVNACEQIYNELVGEMARLMNHETEE